MQSINPNISKIADDYYGKPGANALHAVTEAYQGALLTKSSGLTSAGPAVFGATNKIYNAVHVAATPQSGPISAAFVNSSGDTLPSSVGAHHISIYVYKTDSNNNIIDAQEINTLPIPK